MTLTDWSITDRFPSVEDADAALVFLLCGEGDDVAFEDEGPVASEIRRLASLYKKADDGDADATPMRRVRFPLDGAWLSLIKVDLKDAMTPIDAQRLGSGAAAHIVDDDKSVHIAIANASSARSALAQSFLLGLQLRRYAFKEYKSRKKPEEPPALSLVAPSAMHDDLSGAVAVSNAKASAVHFARDLVNLPPNALNPSAFVDVCRDLAPGKLQVDVLGDDALEADGFRGVLAVGAGSENESFVVTLRDARLSDADVEACLIGKGVCFDSGGLSLKSTTGIRDMKIDMAGAAVVAAVMRYLAQSADPVPVVGVLGLVENMPDGKAYRPGDVLTMKSGKTVEIVNTDAEGRLVLADAMTYAQERFEPKVMIDLATLTGAIITALGHDFAGAFSNNEDLATALKSTASDVDEDLWPMPLAGQHKKLIRSSIADVKQAGGPAASSISAAKFLSEFVNEDVAWTHLDIAGAAHTPSKGKYWDAGASGWGVRTLIEFVETGAYKEFT